jgi:hypothetical protein
MVSECGVSEVHGKKAPTKIGHMAHAPASSRP